MEALRWILYQLVTCRALELIIMWFFLYTNRDRHTTNWFTDWLTHPLNHSLTHPITHSPTYSLMFVYTHIHTHKRTLFLSHSFFHPYNHYSNIYRYTKFRVGDIYCETTLFIMVNVTLINRQHVTKSVGVVIIKPTPKTFNLDILC